MKLSLAHIRDARAVSFGIMTPTGVNAGRVVALVRVTDLATASVGEQRTLAGLARTVVRPHGLTGEIRRATCSSGACRRRCVARAREKCASKVMATVRRGACADSGSGPCRCIRIWPRFSTRNFGTSGNFTLRAAYAGAGVHQASQSDAYPVQVQRRPSTVRITGRTPALPRAGQAYNVELDIADTLVASGTIRVEDGAGNHCDAVLQSGRANCSLSSPAGLQTLRAHYGGDAGYLPSSTSVAHPVQGTSDLALAIAASPITAAGSIEYEVMVTNLGPDPAFQAPIETALSDAVRVSSRRCDVLGGASCVLDESSAHRARVDLPIDAVAHLRISAQALDRHRHGALAQINPPLPDADPDLGNNMDWTGPGAPHPDRVFLDSFE